MHLENCKNSVVCNTFSNFHSKLTSLKSLVVVFDEVKPKAWNGYLYALKT